MNGLIFTYVMTYGGAIISIFNPYCGLLIYICFAIIKPPALWPWCVPPSNYSKIIGIAFLIGWALNGFGDRSLGKAKPIVICAIGYFVWVTLSTMLSDDPSAGGPFVEYLLKIILPFVAGVTLIQTWQQVKVLFWVVLGSCAFLAYEANLAYLQHYDFQHNNFFGLDNNSFSILMVSSFGIALVMGLEEPVLWRRGMFFGIAAAMAHVPMFENSRGGMTGALVAAAAGAAIVPKSLRTWTMMAAAIAVGSVLAGPSVIARYKTSFKERDQLDYSAESRLDLWRDCTIAMCANPIFGIGQEQWGDYATHFGWPKGKEAHSLWFQTAAELGVPGVSFLIGFYLITMWLLWRGSRLLGIPQFSLLARAIIVGIVGFAASASFVTVEGFELPYYIVLVGACGLKVAYAEAAILDVEATLSRDTDAIHPAMHAASCRPV
jgi:O-antigen ligase